MSRTFARALQALCIIAGFVGLVLTAPGLALVMLASEGHEALDKRLRPVKVTWRRS